jgi:hypothetical protein
MIRARFEIPVMYRCNLKCDMCNRLIDLFPWSDSDVTVRDVRMAGRCVKASRIRVVSIKVSGGEPMLHPDLLRIVMELRKWKNEPFKMEVCTNGVTKHSFGRIRKLARVRRSPPDEKSGDNFVRYHKPVLISPVDLGLEGKMTKGCGVLHRCGRVFDAFGFTFCHRAGPLGRILHVDPYRFEPVLEKDDALCRHCIVSMPKVLRYRLWKEAREGGLKWPTPTFARALDRCKESGPMEFRKWRSRSGAAS